MTHLQRKPAFKASSPSSALVDADPRIRYAAAVEIGETGQHDPAGVASLVRLLDNPQEDRLVRQAAASALGKLGAQEARHALLRALVDEDPGLRFQIPAALVRVAPEAAGPHLLGALSDSDAEVRSSAAAALGDLAFHGAKHGLGRLLDDPDRETRLEAAIALARLGDNRGPNALIGHLAYRDHRLTAAEQLFEHPASQAAPAMRKELRRRFGNTLVKAWIAGALARLGDNSGADYLRKSLRSRNPAVTGLTIEILGNLATSWSTALLRIFAETPRGRRWQLEIMDCLRTGMDRRSPQP